METKVVLDMTNVHTFNTVAVLSSYISTNKKGYFYLIKPFVFSILPKEKDKKIDITNIQNKMNSDFGFVDMPRALIVRLLRSEFEKGNIAYDRKKKIFSTKNKYDDADFNNRKRQIEESQRLVIEELERYLNDNYPKKDTDKTIEELFQGFFEYHGFNTLNDTNALGLVDSTSNVYYYRIAKFILENYKKRTEIFSHILELVKGFLAYKAIYFYSKDMVDLSNKKKQGKIINNVKVYLDTPLLIDLLGYNTVEDEAYISELLNIVFDNGGIVMTFQHNLHEVEGILQYYIEQKNRGCLASVKRLEYFKNNNISADSVEIYKNKLRGSLIAKRVQIHEESLYSIEEKDGFIDEQNLADIMKKEYWGKQHDTQIDIDLKSIAGISILRRGKTVDNVNESQHIFITDNSAIIRSVEALKLKGFPLCMLEYDFTSMLWLKTPNKISGLSKKVIEKLSYAACNPSSEWVSAYINTVEELEKVDDFTEEEALCFRSDSKFICDLVEKTGNDASILNDQTIKEYKESLYESAYSEGEQEALKRIRTEQKHKRDDDINDIHEKCNKLQGKVTSFSTCLCWLVFLSIFALTTWQIITQFVQNNVTVTVIASIMLFIELLVLIKELWGKKRFINQIANKVGTFFYDRKYKNLKNKMEESYKHYGMNI